jgi:hypothetical protein
VTIPENPISTLWQWVARAPLPVVVALLVILSGWVYAVDNKAAEALTQAAVAVESKREQARRLEKMDEKLDKLLEAVVQIQAEQKQAEKTAAKTVADQAAPKKKENR